MTRYIFPTHDPILSELNQKWCRTDQEIADEMGFDKDTIRKHRNRLGLPQYHRPMPVSLYHERDRNLPPPKVKPNPLGIAKLWLGKRLVEKPAGYFLDGCPVNLTCIMQAANRVIKANGGEQCGYHPLWIIQ